MEEYKSNSFASKEKAKKEEKKLEMITSAPAKAVKKSFWQLVLEKGKQAWIFAKDEVIIPEGKKVIANMFNSLVDSIVYGENGPRNKSNIPGSRVSYRSYYDSQQRNYDSRYSTPNRTVNNTTKLDDILLNSRGDADAVLTQMDDIIAKYGFVKVADLYDLVGLPSVYTDNNYGWTDLRTAQVIRQHDGYLLSLPRPMSID